MSKLYTLDGSLIHNIKLSIEEYSERILFSGLQIKPETKQTWLSNLRALHKKMQSKSLCLGQSTIRKFEHLMCNFELSSKGFISLETKLALQASAVCFSITPTMQLATEKSPWSDDVNFQPYFIELCTLNYREIQEMRQVLNHFKPDNLMAMLSDLVIRDSNNTAFDPVREPSNDNMVFVSHLKKHNFGNNSHRDLGFENKFSHNSTGDYSFGGNKFGQDNFDTSHVYYSSHPTNNKSGGNGFRDGNVRNKSIGNSFSDGNHRQSDRESNTWRGFTFGASGSQKRSMSPPNPNQYNKNRPTGVNDIHFEQNTFFF